MPHRYKYKIEYKTFKTSSIIIAIISTIVLYNLLPVAKQLYKMPTKETVIFVFLVIILCWCLFGAIYNLWKNKYLSDLSKRNPDIIVDEDSIYLQQEKNKKRIQIFFEDIFLCEEITVSEAQDKYYIYLMYFYDTKQFKSKEHIFLKKNMNAKEYEKFRDLLLLETKQKSPLINLDEGEQDLSNK